MTGTSEKPTEPVTNDAPQLSFFGGSLALSIDSVDVMALASIRGLGIHGIRRLIEHYRDLSLIWTAPSTEVAEILRAAKVTNHQLVSREISENSRALKTDASEALSKLSARNISLVPVNTEHFPVRLTDVRPTPYWLFVEGNQSVLSARWPVAVVGTRKPSKPGIEAAARVSSWLVRRGVTVVSGLAEGIDEAAHKAAVDADAPTIAVLGHGVSLAFPASTAALRKQIVESSGAVVTEYFPNDRYDRSKFVQRNRIQAGLAKAVFAVDATYESGTAHTVRFAAQYHRKLIGVRANGFSSGIVKLLEELGASIVDLGDPRADQELASLLTEAFGEPVPIEPLLPASHLLNGVVREVVDLFKRYGLTTGDLDALTEGVRRILEEKSH